MRFAREGTLWLPVAEQEWRFEEMLASIEDAIMYGPHTMARFADQRRQHRADRRRRRRHARYNRGRTGVRPRKRGGL